MAGLGRSKPEGHEIRVGEGSYEMTDAATTALITAVASLIVAILSGVIALRNNNKSRSNSLEIQKLKGVINDDSERLKAKLSHGQIWLNPMER